MENYIIVLVIVLQITSGHRSEMLEMKCSGKALEFL